MNYSFIELTIKTTFVVLTIISFGRLKKLFTAMLSEHRIKTINLMSVVLVLYLSFFADKSSPLGGAFFWDINCRSCVYDRHIFPFYFALVLLLLSFMNKSKIIFTFLLCLLLQEIFVTIIAFDYLFLQDVKL
jgi:hypothetical protein